MFGRKRSGRTLRRFGATFCVLLIAAGTFAAAALADYTINYGPYQYWTTGQNANTVYDAAGHRWYADHMREKSCGGLADCSARVTFIKSDGSWWYSYTDITSGYNVRHVYSDKPAHKPRFQ